jgi:hypothetical protein
MVKFMMIMMMTVLRTAIIPSNMSVSAQTITPPTAPLLTGWHFRITALQEDGFLDVLDVDDDALPKNQTTTMTGGGHRVQYSGYLIEMIAAIAQQANFTYTLVTPSGLGSKCVPQVQISEEEWENVATTTTTTTTSTTSNTTTTTTTKKNETDTTVTKATTLSSSSSSSKEGPYSSIYRTQYNCGTSDVTDFTLQNTTYGSDMYLGMYYVTPSRLLENQFTIPFVPPFSGTVAMFGTATGIANFEDLVQQQQLGSIDPYQTCGPGGTALIDAVQESYPGLQIRGIFGGEEDIYQAFYQQECTVYVIDAPIAAQFVLRRARKGQCTDQTGMVRSGGGGSNCCYRYCFCCSVNSIFPPLTFSFFQKYDFFVTSPTFLSLIVFFTQLLLAHWSDW